MRLPAPGFFLLLMLFMLGVSVADADTVRPMWTVVEVSGAVDIRDAGNNRLGMKPGTKLNAPFAIITSGDGHAVLAHGQDRLTVSPDSRVAVPQPTTAESGIITRIRQTLGSVLYQDEHRTKDSFEVDTPYLVSVVKGTTFNIRVTPDDTTVALIEGSLFLHTPDMKAELLLKPGQAAIKTRLSKGIILKDQQSLSAPRQGAITVAKDGEAPTSNMTTDQFPGGARPSRSNSSEHSVMTDISNMDTVDRLSTNWDISAITDIGTRVDGGNLVDLGASVSGVSSSAAISSGSLVDLGTSVGGISTNTSIGSDSVIDLGTSVGDVSTTTSIGGSSVVDVSASIGGGSLADLGTGVGDVSASASVGGGSAVDLGASVGGISAGVTVGGSGSLIDLSSNVTSTSPTTDLSSTTTTVAPTTPTTTTTTTTTQPSILAPLISTITLPGL